MSVHPSALISPNAKLGENVAVGPFSVIGDAVIGDGAIIHSHVVIGDGVEIGQAVEIFPGALIGREPKAAGATSRPIEFERQLTIGDGCSIGPHAVIYYGVEIGRATLIGDGASIREQCRIGSNCIISRYVTVNYNTTVGDGVKVMDLSHLTDMVVEDGAFISVLVATVNDNLVKAGFGGHVVGPVVRAGSVIGGGATLLPGIEVDRTPSSAPARWSPRRLGPATA